MLNPIYKKIYQKIKKYDTIVVARHIGPDPDAVTTQMALKDSIKLTFPLDPLANTQILIIYITMLG